MYIDPKHLRGAARFDLGRYRPYPKSQAERFSPPARKSR